MREPSPSPSSSSSSSSSLRRGVSVALAMSGSRGKKMMMMMKKNKNRSEINEQQRRRREPHYQEGEEEEEEEEEEEPSSLASSSSSSSSSWKNNSSRKYDSSVSVSVSSSVSSSSSSASCCCDPSSSTRCSRRTGEEDELKVVLLVEEEEEEEEEEALPERQQRPTRSSSCPSHALLGAAGSSAGAGAGAGSAAHGHHHSAFAVAQSLLLGGKARAGSKRQRRRPWSTGVGGGASPGLLSSSWSTPRALDMRGLEGSPAHGEVPPLSSPLLSCRSLVPEVGAPDVVKLQHLGSGCSSNVYLAIHRAKLQLMAVKEVPLTSALVRDMVRKEVLALQPQSTPLLSSKLRGCEESACPHIVRYYGCMELAHSGVARIAVEYVAGGSLGRWVEDGVAAPEPWLASVARQCLEALHFLHRGGRCHNDIKPVNILLTLSGEAKLADFGLSSVGSDVREEEGEDGLTSMDGTMRFMAPERLSGQPCTCLSDVWSLGLSLSSVALGRVPVGRSSSPFGQLSEADRVGGVMAAADHLSPSLRDFLCSCLRTRPSERAGVEELLAHEFITGRTDWRADAACEAAVLSRVSALSPGLWIMPEEVVAELAAVAEASPAVPLAPYSCSSVRRLALELGTPFRELQQLLTSRGLAVQPPCSAVVDVSADLDLEEVGGSDDDGNVSCVDSDSLSFFGDSGADSTFNFSSVSQHHHQRSPVNLGGSSRSLGGSRRGRSSLGDPHELASQMHRSLRQSSHFVNMHWHTNCFTGIDAVQWLIASGLAATDEEAVAIGNEMLEAGAVHHIQSERVFENTRVFYKFGQRVTLRRIGSHSSSAWTTGRSSSTSSIPTSAERDRRRRFVPGFFQRLRRVTCPEFHLSSTA
jgi:serine/threonine protein kinase